MYFYFSKSKSVFIILLLLLVTRNSVAQTEFNFNFQDPCETVDVKLFSGTVKGITPKFEMDEIKKRLPCFTGETKEGEVYNYSGGVFYTNLDLYFYTYADVINIRTGTKAMVEPNVFGKSRADVESLIGFIIPKVKNLEQELAGWLVKSKPFNVNSPDYSYFKGKDFLLAIRYNKNNIAQEIFITVPKPSIYESLTFTTKPKTESKPKDTTPPTLKITQPEISRAIKKKSTSRFLTIQGEAKDEKGKVSVIIKNGTSSITVEPEINEKFDKVILLSEGDNNIFVQAKDEAGNVAEQSFVINGSFEISKSNTAATVTSNRLALVIGNADYKGGQKLKNPVNDANLMASTLQSLGFEVLTATNASKQEMESAIRDFSKKLPNYKVALFYYAGHGVQVDGENFLIPVDAQLNDKTDTKFEAIKVNYVVEEFERFPDNINIVILDACRNNPFRSWTRGNEGGFKAINPSSGTIISFATSEGATASDGVGKNGLFTEELVKQMKVSQPIESVFKKTRVEVLKKSNRSQSPQEWSQLTGDFYFIK